MHRPTTSHLIMLFFASTIIGVLASDKPLGVPSSPVKFVLESKGDKLADGQNCILSINSLVDSRIVYRSDAALGESETTLLPSGEYEANAVVYEPMHTAVIRFRVPRQDDVALELKEAAIHHLKIKVVDHADQPVEGCNLKLSFAQNRYARILNSKSGNQHRIVSGDDGIVRFVLQGAAPEECQIYTSSRGKIVPLKHTISRSDWDKERAMTLRVSQKRMNGRMNCFLAIDGRKLPFSEGAATLIDREVSSATLRLVSAKDERADFSFRIQGDVVDLFGLADGEYFVQRVDLIAKGVSKELIPIDEVTITIEDGSLLKKNEALTLVPENKTPFTVIVTDGVEPVAEASVSVNTRLLSIGDKTDDNGRCSVLLRPGAYRVQVGHRLFATEAKVVDVGVRPDALRVELKKRPTISGRVTFNGKPVTDTNVLISLGQKKEFSRTDNLGRYEIPIVTEERFLLGVNFDGFTEFVRFETTEDKFERVVDLDLSPRFPVTINIKGRYKGLIGRKAALYVVPKGMGEPAAFFDIPQGGSVATTVIEGPYELYIVTVSNAEDSGEDAPKASRDYIVYDVGEMVLTRNNRVVTLSLDKKPASMSLEDLMNELHFRFSK